MRYLTLILESSQTRTKTIEAMMAALSSGDSGAAYKLAHQSYEATQKSLEEISALHVPPALEAAHELFKKAFRSYMSSDSAWARYARSEDPSDHEDAMDSQKEGASLMDQATGETSRATENNIDLAYFHDMFVLDGKHFFIGMPSGDKADFYTSIVAAYDSAIENTEIAIDEIRKPFFAGWEVAMDAREAIEMVYDFLLEKFIISWDITLRDGTPVPCDTENKKKLTMSAKADICAELVRIIRLWQLSS